MKKSQPESMGAGRQKGPPVMADAGGGEMAIKAAQSANKEKSLYLSFFGMMFSFIVMSVSC
jgi:hypothetical protein